MSRVGHRCSKTSSNSTFRSYLKTCGRPTVSTCSYDTELILLLVSPSSFRRLPPGPTDTSVLWQQLYSRGSGGPEAPHTCHHPPGTGHTTAPQQVHTDACMMLLVLHLLTCAADSFSLNKLCVCVISFVCQQSVCWCVVSKSVNIVSKIKQQRSGASLK